MAGTQPVWRYSIPESAQKDNIQYNNSVTSERFLSREEFHCLAHNKLLEIVEKQPLNRCN